MPLQPWKPIRLAFDMEGEVDRAFSNLIFKPWGQAAGQLWQPDIDLFETETGYLLEADLPGVDPKDIHLEISEHNVALYGVRHSTTYVKTARRVSVERRKGSFSRSFQLEHAIDTQHAKYEYKDGIFRADLPRKKTNPQLSGN